MKIQYLQKASRIEDHYAKQNKLDSGKNHHIFFHYAEWNTTQ